MKIYLASIIFWMACCLPAFADAGGISGGSGGYVIDTYYLSPEEIQALEEVLKNNEQVYFDGIQDFIKPIEVYRDQYNQLIISAQRVGGPGMVELIEKGR
jgi:hypothetical protein